VAKKPAKPTSEEPQDKPKRGVQSLRFMIPPDHAEAKGIPDPVQIKAVVGRPTKYDPSWMLEDVIAIGRIGGSHTEMAVELGIHRDTFYEWLKIHEDFSDAVKIADAAAQTWWERASRSGAIGLIPNWNPTTYIFNMKNRFRDSYSDKPTAPETGQVQVMSVTIDSRLLDAEQRDVLRQTLLAAKAASNTTVIEGEYEEGED